MSAFGGKADIARQTDIWPLPISFPYRSPLFTVNARFVRETAGQFPDQYASDMICAPICLGRPGRGSQGRGIFLKPCHAIVANQQFLPGPVEPVIGRGWPYGFRHWYPTYHTNLAVLFR